MRLSLLIEKDVVYQNTVVGKIDGVCWQKGVPCLLQCGEKFFSADRAKVNDTIVCNSLQPSTSLPKLQLSKCVYDTDGKLLGHVQDVDLTSTLKVKSVTLDNGTIIFPSKIVANNDIVTVRAARPTKAKKKMRSNCQNQTQDDLTKSKPICTVEQVVNFAQVGVDCHKTDATQNAVALGVQTRPLAIAPKRKSGDFSFLVGKRVDKNIVSFWGELMIRKGEIVTREVYLKARTFGKLTELCLHTK